MPENLRFLSSKYRLKNIRNPLLILIGKIILKMDQILDLKMGIKLRYLADLGTFKFQVQINSEVILPR